MLELASSFLKQAPPEPFHSQDLKAYSTNWWPYIPLLPIPENLMLYQENIS